MMHLTMIARTVVILAIGVLATACSDGTGPEAPQVGGRWTVSPLAQDTDGMGYECAIADMTLVLTQTANRVSGTTVGGSLFCGGDPGYIDSMAGAGEVHGDTVTIVLNGEPGEWHFTGIVGTATMRGTFKVRAIDGRDVFTVARGLFVASRNYCGEKQGMEATYGSFWTS